MTGDVEGMRRAFKDWDPALWTVVGAVEKCLKWKMCHMEELEKWIKGNVALLGDACHPTLPYQAQGAAMAVEDGAVLGVLLGQWAKSTAVRDKSPSRLHDVLQLYESIRKKLTTLQYEGAVQTWKLFQIESSPERKARDRELKNIDWEAEDNGCTWSYGNTKYQKTLVGFDCVLDARDKFKIWEGKFKDVEFQAEWT